jgi:hypothetical protein
MNAAFKKNAGLFVLAGGIWVFCRVVFHPLFQAVKNQEAIEFLAATLGTIFTIVITMILLNKQTEVEHAREKQQKVFEEKVNLYNLTIERIQTILADEIISDEELNEVKFLLVKTQMIAGDDVISAFEQIDSKISEIYLASSTNEVPSVGTDAKIEIMRRLQGFANCCRVELGLSDRKIDDKLNDKIFATTQKVQARSAERKAKFSMKSVPGLVDNIEAFCLNNLDLSIQLAEEYYYPHLSMCVLDAIYSINANYNATKQVPIRYCEHFSLSKTRSAKTDTYPPVEEQESIDDFIKRMSSQSIEDIAKNILKNQQRTSTKNGILKADAVLQFAKILQEFGVSCFQDIAKKKLMESPEFENRILSIKGQGSGVSLRYFFMLAGDQNSVKPDRMIKRFLSEISGCSPDNLSNDEIQQVLVEIAGRLKAENGTSLSPRLLDNMIWQYQREKSAV